MSAFVGFIGATIAYGVGLWLITRSWRKRYREAMVQRFIAEKMQEALMHRLMIRNVYCEVCHEPFADEQMACLRIGKDNQFGTLAHGVCLAPLPDNEVIRTS